MRNQRGVVNLLLTRHLSFLCGRCLVLIIAWSLIISLVFRIDLLQRIMEEPFSYESPRRIVHATPYTEHSFELVAVGTLN